MPTITIALPSYVTELQAEPFPASATSEVATTASLTAGAGSIVVAATGGAWCWRFTECGPGYRKTRFCAVAADGSYASLVDLDPGTLVATVEPADPAWEATANAALAAAVTVNSKVDRGRLAFDVKDYGAIGNNVATDTTAILAAAAALQASGQAGTLWFPALPSGGAYRCTSPLPNVNGMRVAGPSSVTQLKFIGCDMFTVATSLSGLVIEGLNIIVSGGHVFNVGAGSFHHNRVRDCKMWTVSDNKSFLYASGNGDVLGNWFENLELTRNSTHTASGFWIVNGAGGANANVWKRITANSGNCTGAPFWHIEASATGTYAYDNSFENIVGEQNAGGLIRLLSNNGPSFRDVWDWDVSIGGGYVDHVIQVGKSSTSTTESRGITAINSGRRGGTLGVGLYDFYCSPNTRQVSLQGVGNHTPTPVVALPTNGGFQTDSGALRAATGAVLQTGRNTTANRPAAAPAGQGAMFYDTTLGKPVWSDGSNWRDASGGIV